VRSMVIMSCYSLAPYGLTIAIIDIGRVVTLLW